MGGEGGQGEGGRQKKKWSNHLSFETLLPLVLRQLEYIDPPSLFPLLLLFTFSPPPLFFHCTVIEGSFKVSRLVSPHSNSPQDPHQWEEEAPTGIPHWTSRIGRTTHSLHTLRGYLPAYILPQSAPYLVHSTQFTTTVRALYGTYSVRANTRAQTENGPLA